MAVELSEDRRFVTRINLKTAVKTSRQEPIDFCLNSKELYLVIGWSCVYDEKGDKSIKAYQE